MRRFLRRFVLAGVALGAVLLVLVYGFGLRLVVTDGSGIPWPRFVEPSDVHYEELERQRAAQRAAARAAAQPAASAAEADGPAADVPPVPPPAPTPPEPATMETETAPAEPAPVSVRTAAGTPDAPADARPSGGYWTGFRGPRRDGIYDEMPLRFDWNVRPPAPAWKQPIGEGYASFAAGNGLVYTIEQRRDQEVVAAYELETGREVWTNAWAAAFRERMGGDGPRATPAFHEGKVYALGGLGELRCIDARTGRTLWRKNILTDNGASNIQWGMAASPLVVDGKVIVIPGGRGGRSVVAYDAATGARVWNALDDEAAYTAPMVAVLNRRRQLIAVTAQRAVGLTIEDGRLLWEYPWVTDFNINASQPIVVADNRVFLSAGYGHGAAVFELTPQGDRFTARTVWQNVRMKNKFTSSVLRDGYIYGLDENILACIRAEDGELAWKGGRYGYGQLVLAGDHLIVLTERGDLALVKATPEGHQEVARIPAIEGKTWNHPALERGWLIVRNGVEMAGFRLFQN